MPSRIPIDVNELSFYSFFTKYSLMDSYGFTSGLISTLLRKILPRVPERDTIEWHFNQKGISVKDVIGQVDVAEVQQSPIAKELDLSIKALCSKVVAFGLDHQMQKRLRYLNIKGDCFQLLSDQSSKIADPDPDTLIIMESLLSEVDAVIIELRKNKQKIGTTLHLTLVTKRVLEYVERTRKLIQLKSNIKSTEAWEGLFAEHLTYQKERNSISKYFSSHFDLLALEIVEHTSNKGEKYIAENKSDLKSFWHRSVIGGAFVAFFALFKIMIDNYDISMIQVALSYSINYALCFVVVKQLGGIIATKQPAMTASTIAKNIDKNYNLKYDSIQEVVILIRRVFRTQIICLLGNFIMALILALIIGLIIKTDYFTNPIDPKKAEYLIYQVLPQNGKIIFYATIAGIFLAMTGFVSGYFDNKVISSKIPYRINNSRFLRNVKFVSFLKSKFAGFIAKNLGSISGNVGLGFFLGCAFLLEVIFPFSVDIRHIAFSSANVGYALVNGSFDLSVILLAVLGVMIIGLTNFIVSFSITLSLALKSRGGTFRILPKLFYYSIKDLLSHPREYVRIK